MFVSRYFMGFCYDYFLFGSEISCHLSLVQCPSVLVYRSIALCSEPFWGRTVLMSHIAIGDWRRTKEKGQPRSYLLLSSWGVPFPCDILWLGRKVSNSQSILTIKGESRLKMKTQYKYCHLLQTGENVDSGFKACPWINIDCKVEWF